MKTLEELKKSVLEDGVIDKVEVQEIRNVIYADGKIEKEEAEFLFALNDAVSGNNNDSSWNELMVEAITSFVLDDDETPGVVDETEAEWLIQKITADGNIDGVERAILENIKKKAKQIPEQLKKL